MSYNDIPGFIEEIYNFTVNFRDSDGKLLYSMQITDIYDPTSLIFVENINQSFILNRKYSFEIIDETK